MKTKRNIIRIIHLIGAAAIGTFVYSPYGDLEAFKMAMQIVVIPVLSLSGLWLWKPQWFSFKKGVQVVALALLVQGVQAQEVAPKTCLSGGTGSFYVGDKTLETSGFDFFLPEAATSLEPGLFQLGGDGYFFINRLLIGGGGHYSKGAELVHDGNNYQVQGGGGYFSIGYGVWKQPGFILFPYANIGVEAISLDKELDQDIAFDPNQFTAMNYGVASPTLDLGIGTDWFPLKKGWKVGLKVGYQFALNAAPDWYHTSGNRIEDPQLPDVGLSGFYLRLSVGGGYLK